MPQTRAWLIGAGPGDAELLTLKAVRALGQADVILVDDLVHADTLQHARVDAEIGYVGKRGGRVSIPQQAIIERMLGYLRAGRSVARLKGGDPFIFGRGGEEWQALTEAGAAVEVISGVSAGIAAPATLGIALTRRDYAQGVIFVTGYSAGEQQPDWRQLAATGMTLVIYMGITRIAAIAAALLEGGLAADTPCAAISSATLPSQRHAICALRDLPATVERQQLASPAIVVIGAVVRAGHMVAPPGMLASA